MNNNIFQHNFQLCVWGNIFPHTWKSHGRWPWQKLVAKNKFWFCSLRKSRPCIIIEHEHCLDYDDPKKVFLVSDHSDQSTVALCKKKKTSHKWTSFTQITDIHFGQKIKLSTFRLHVMHSHPTHTLCPVHHNCLYLPYWGRQVHNY